MRKYSVVTTAAIPSLVALLWLTSCGGGSQGGAPAEVQVTLSEYKIVLDKSSIPAGPVKFIISNAGTAVHEVVLEAAGDVDKPFEVNGKESEVEDVGPGKSVTLAWTIDKPGQYQLACHIDEPRDHYAAGMVTTFAVTAR